VILVRHGESAFNAAFNATRVDPGIPDPDLTAEGRRQILAAARALGARDVRRLVASPYTRSLQSVAILAEILDLPVTVDVRVRERAYFTCDVGTPRPALVERWPTFAFDGLEDRWWPEGIESEADLSIRAGDFRRHMADSPDWPHVTVVSHWAFIRELTGHPVANGEMVVFDPQSGEAAPHEP